MKCSSLLQEKRRLRTGEFALSPTHTFRTVSFLCERPGLHCSFAATFKLLTSVDVALIGPIAVVHSRLSKTYVSTPK